jgi:hypothetical protein
LLAAAGAGGPLFIWMYRKQAEEARRSFAWFKANISTAPPGAGPKPPSEP